MAPSYRDRPVTQVRRKDRKLDAPEWIDRFLRIAPVGHLAVSLSGEPFLHSNLFWYDGDAVYLHTAGMGKFRTLIDAGAARACFSVTEHGRLLPADTPLDFSTEYASVIAYGPVALVSDRSRKRRALEGLMAKYAPHLQPGVDYRPMPDDDVDQTSVFCLSIEERVGKHNVKPEDYPAYHYAADSFIAVERAAGRVTVRPKEIA